MTESSHAWVEKELNFSDAMREAVALYHDNAWWASQNLAQQIFDAWPDEPAGANLLGMIAHKTDNPTRALFYFYQALQKNPQSLPTYQNIGIALASVRGVLSEAQLQPLMAGIRASQIPEAPMNAIVLTLLDWLNFRRDGEMARCASIFQHWLVPLVRWACEKSYFDLLLRLEMRIYQDYIKQDKSEVHATACYTPIGESLAEAGQKAKRLWMPEQQAMLEKNPKLIAVFVHRTSLLIHVEQLLSWLEGRQALADLGQGDGKSVRVYAFSGDDAVFCQACENLGAEVVLLDTLTSTESYAVRLQVLQARLASDGIETLVWLSAPPLLIFASQLPLAKSIIWWSFKYHHLPWATLHAKITSSKILDQAFEQQGWLRTPLCEWSSENADEEPFILLAKQMALCIA